MKRGLKIGITAFLIVAEIAIFFFVPVHVVKWNNQFFYATMYDFIVHSEVEVYPGIILNANYSAVLFLPYLLAIIGLLLGCFSKGSKMKTWTAVFCVMMSALLLLIFGRSSTCFSAMTGDSLFSDPETWAFYHFGYCVLISVYICFENFYRPKRQAKSAP